MKAIMAVIGSGYGDCGKGLVTDYFAAAAGPDTTVVRFCGGANAGHTVQTPEGLRHVFSHFGSGTLAGAGTYLGSKFIVNPLLFMKEFKELAAIGIYPEITINPYCQFTTPFDMMINQFIEDSRGMRRHGSVGVGINETVTRYDAGYNGISLHAFDRPHFLEVCLKEIREIYVPRRLDELELELDEKQKALLMDDGVIDRFVSDATEMAKLFKTRDPDYLLESKNIIFEGSQGLLIDELHGEYPYVTRSRTGLVNVIPICESLGIRELDISYVSRAYATRHGAGPFPLEYPEMKFEDKTNKEHPWQGNLRFGALDIDRILDVILLDQVEALGDVKLRSGLVLTCIDQVENNDGIPYKVNGEMHHGRWARMATSFIDSSNGMLEKKNSLFSFGPTRSTVQKW